MRHRAIAAAQHNVGPTDHLLTVERAQGHRMIWQYGSAIKATPHDAWLADPGGRWQQGPIPCPYGSAPSRRVHPLDP